MTQPPSIQTPRLTLVATTLQHIEAELQSALALAPLLDATIPPSWPPGEYDRDALLFFRDRLLEGGPSHVGWYGWYAMTRSSGDQRPSLVAGAGYFGPPADATVEIGYSVIPEARGQGYATEIVQALLDRAFAQPEVRTVVAHTTDANPASIGVLLRCGFLRVGPGAEAGTVMYRAEKSSPA